MIINIIYGEVVNGIINVKVGKGFTNLVNHVKSNKHNVTDLAHMFDGPRHQSIEREQCNCCQTDVYRCNSIH
jgi:hypothetical protein